MPSERCVDTAVRPITVQHESVSARTSTSTCASTPRTGICACGGRLGAAHPMCVRSFREGRRTRARGTGAPPGSPDSCAVAAGAMAAAVMVCVRSGAAAVVVAAGCGDCGGCRGLWRMQRQMQRVLALISRALEPRTVTSERSGPLLTGQARTASALRSKSERSDALAATGAAVSYAAANARMMNMPEMSSNSTFAVSNS